MVEILDACSGGVEMNRLLPYNAPSWAANLKGLPKYFIKVCALLSNIVDEISEHEILF